MNTWISKFRLDTTTGAGKNIWFTFFLTILIVFANFQRLILPLWIISLAIGLIILFQFVSFIFLVYLTIKNWNRNVDDKIKVAFLLILFLIVVLTTGELGRRIMF